MLIKNRALWIGVAASVVFLALFAWFFARDFDKVSDAFSSANYFYIIPAIGFYVVSLWIRTLRWRLMLRPLMKNGTERALFPVVVVGYMANNLIPLRLGEIVRAYYLNLREKVAVSAGIGTVALERASDVVALLLLLGIAILAGSIGFQSALGEVAENTPGGAVGLAVMALLPFVVAFGLIAYVVFASTEHISAILQSMLRFLPEPLQLRLIRIAVNLISGLAIVRSPSGFARVLALSVFIWIAEIAMYYTIALGFDMRSAFDSQTQFLAAIVVFGSAANLGGTIPAGPGSLGPFDLFGAAALVGIGIEREVASVYALTVHISLWITPTIAGAVILLMDRTSLINLAKSAERRRHDDATDETTSASRSNRGGVELS